MKTHKEKIIEILKEYRMVYNEPFRPINRIPDDNEFALRIHALYTTEISDGEIDYDDIRKFLQSQDITKSYQTIYDKNWNEVSIESLLIASIERQR